MKVLLDTNRPLETPKALPLNSNAQKAMKPTKPLEVRKSVKTARPRKNATSTTPT